MNLKIWSVVILIALSGCSTNNKSNILQYGEGVYMSSAGSSYSLTKAVSKAVKDANSFCSEKQLKMQPISREVSEEKLKEITLLFKCI